MTSGLLCGGNCYLRVLYLDRVRENCTSSLRAAGPEPRVCVCRGLLIAEQVEAASIYALIKYVYSMRNILFQFRNGTEDLHKQQLPLIEFTLN